MPSISSTLTAAAVLLGVASANPIIAKRSFSIDQVERGVFLRNGAQQRAKTYRKYGAPVPDHVQSAAAAAVTGSAPANPGDEYDSLYLSPVTLGNTTVQLDFDTGSADL
jgi:aspergillopepsin I